MLNRINEINFTNQIYQNASMGMDSISCLLYNKISDDSIRSDMMEQYFRYNNIALKAEELLANINPIFYNRVFASSLSLWETFNSNVLKKNSADYIAEMIIQGSMKGIIDTTRLQKKYLGISDFAKSLSDEFIYAEENNIQEMKKYLQ